MILISSENTLSYIKYKYVSYQRDIQLGEKVVISHRLKFSISQFEVLIDFNSHARNSGRVSPK